MYENACERGILEIGFRIVGILVYMGGWVKDRSRSVDGAFMIRIRHRRAYGQQRRVGAPL